MHRFFVTPGLLTAAESSPLRRMVLPAALAHQVRDVLRLTSDERLILLDNSGDEIEARIVTTGRAGVEVELLERRAARPREQLRLVLYQGLLKSARFEWVLEKGTELGVSAFVPLHCQRSLAGLEMVGPAKLQRWRRILQEAAEQCGRTRIPEVLSVRSFSQALAEQPSGALIVLPWEGERQLSLRTALRAASPALRRAADSPPLIAIFIGPEGGLTLDEVTLARQRGALVVSLGPRILRSETAAIAAVANVIYEYEEWRSQRDETDGSLVDHSIASCYDNAT